MYKTVRHGENSLQYTILPQEEGVVHVKPRKLRKKGKTAAILTVTVILICGIIATAVLVPLLLTSDFVVLPAAFQKFSVSSLRRSHSGNHVMVVAKKPHGWINPHHAPIHPNGNNRTYTNILAKSQGMSNIRVNSTAAETTTVPTTTMKLTTERTTRIASGEAGAIAEVDKKAMIEENLLKEYDRGKFTQAPIGRNYLDISTTTRSSGGHELFADGVVRLSSTETPTTYSPWFHQGWSFGDTVSYVRWSGSNVTENFITITVGSIVVLLCLVVIFVVWMHRRRTLRNGANKNSTDNKTDDKDTLLKDSTAGSEEE